jgi:ppGpp synthetase/RelA/SpoT-type nucleotidyltranferase/predicted phosphodiesterase
LGVNDLNILHISDVHFGVTDIEGEQPRITEALIEAVHAHAKPPDLCIFSGDLANFGRASEFETGEQWLRRLVRDEWKSDLIVVPGNHDVDRGATRPHLFRACATDESVYADWSLARSVNCDHLRPFFDWYNAAKARLPLRGEWTNPFGLYFRKEATPFPVHVICLNSAMFCCDEHDEENLIVDIRTLNAWLEAAYRDKGLVIVVSHHPLDFLTPWNRLGTETILAQERGAHLFLHGHKHESSASSRGESSGYGLTTLAAGAAYQGSEWRQGFAFYEFDFDAREITSRVYQYELTPGKWIADNARSRKFVANIPLYRNGGVAPADPVANPPAPGPTPARDVQAPAGSASSPLRDPFELFSPSIAPAAPETSEHRSIPDSKPLGQAQVDDEQLAQAVDARRHAASYIQSRVLHYFSEQEIDAEHYYAVTSRIKRSQRIMDKYIDRRQGDSTYKLESMTDICGFRIVTRYQDEIPGVVQTLLSDIEDPAQTRSPFHPERQIAVEFNSFSTEVDSLPLVERVRAICNQSKLKPLWSHRVRDTGYSSIHFLATVAIEAGYSVREMRVEIQIRSAFEDAWGEIDHHIDYRERRGKKDVPRNKHLSVLKSMVDALISYVDLIKKQSEESRGARPPVIQTSRSVNTPADQLVRLTRLPKDIYQRVEQAFDNWQQAYDSRKSERPDPVLFKKGAKAFEALLNEFVDKPETGNEDKSEADKKLPEDLKDELEYVLRVEYAYLLQYTGEQADTEQAESVYINILHKWPEDVTANYRLGAIYRKLADKVDANRGTSNEYLDKSKAYLDRAMQSVAKGTDKRITKSHAVYDSLRRDVGLTAWRISEDSYRPMEARKEALLFALRSAYDVIHNPTADDGPIEANTRIADITSLSAINDLLYFRWYQTALGAGDEGFSISLAEELRYREKLYVFYKSRSADQHEYNFIDTLLRLYAEAGDQEKAERLALDLVSVLQKMVLKQAPNRTLPQFGTTYWYGALLKQLNFDQGDALTYAHDFLKKVGYPQPEGT